MTALPLPLQRWLLVMTFCLTTTGIASTAIAQRAADQDEEAGPRQVRMATIISQLRREARQSFREAQRWPRSTADFAQEKNWTVERDRLHAVFLQRLDPNPAIDGYIKWQLLSFEPDFSTYDTTQWNRLIRVAPRPLTTPSPRPQAVRNGDYEVSFFSGRQLGYVRSLQAVVGDGVAVYSPSTGVVSGAGITGANRRGVGAEGVVQLNRELAAARKQVRQANGPVYVYRNTLLNAAPTEDGFRFAAILREVNQRLDANDATALDMLDYLLEVGPDMVDQLADGGRQTLMEWTVQLANRRIDYLRAFDTDLRGDLVPDVDPLELPRDQLETLHLMLRDTEAYRQEMANREAANDEADGDDNDTPPTLPGLDGRLPPTELADDDDDEEQQ